MEVAEEAKALTFDRAVALCALKRRLKKLPPQPVQAQLLLEEPAHHSIRKTTPSLLRSLTAVRNLEEKSATRSDGFRARCR